MLDNAVETVEKARELGVTIIHTPISFTEDYHELSPEPYGILKGVVDTNCCVESTMRTAYEKGYNVITLTDCVAATSEEEHQNAIAKDYQMFLRPMTHGQLLDALASGGAVADTRRGYTD